ncbi:MAG: hypothetical protein AMK70_05935 [Nitrospira bacterium SG8_35_1]|nr:MAG: hypothetical protein AMK70_05935 [Nitrospira bacterium SG8_35_1]
MPEQVRNNRHRVSWFRYQGWKRGWILRSVSEDDRWKRLDSEQVGMSEKYSEDDSKVKGPPPMGCGPCYSCSTLK